jgi:hypothetical protein
MKRHGPLRRRAQSASAAPGIFVRRPKETFATQSEVEQTSLSGSLRAAASATHPHNSDQLFGGQAWLTRQQTTVSGSFTDRTPAAECHFYSALYGVDCIWEAEAFLGHIAVAVGHVLVPRSRNPCTLAGKRHHWVEPLRAMAIHFDGREIVYDVRSKV